MSHATGFGKIRIVSVRKQLQRDANGMLTLQFATAKQRSQLVRLTMKKEDVTRLMIDVFGWISRPVASILAQKYLALHISVLTGVTPKTDVCGILLLVTVMMTLSLYRSHAVNI